MATPPFNDTGAAEAQTELLPTAIPARSDPLRLRTKWFRPHLADDVTLDHPLQGALHFAALATAIAHQMCALEIYRQLPQDEWTIGIWRFELFVSYVYLFAPVFQWSVIAYGVEHLPRWAQTTLQVIEGFTLFCLAGGLTATTLWRDQFTCGRTVRLTCDNFNGVVAAFFNMQVAGVVFFALTFYGSRIYGCVRPEACGTWHLAALRESTFRVRFPLLFGGHLIQIAISVALIPLAGVALHFSYWPTFSSASFLLLTYINIQNTVISTVLLLQSVLLPRCPRGRRMGKIIEVVAMLTAAVGAFDVGFWKAEYGCELVSDEACIVIQSSMRIFFALEVTSACTHLVMACAEGLIKEENAQNLMKIDNQLAIALGFGIKYGGILLFSPIIGPVWLYQRCFPSQANSEGEPVSPQEDEAKRPLDDTSTASSVAQVESCTNQPAQNSQIEAATPNTEVDALAGQAKAESEKIGHAL